MIDPKSDLTIRGFFLANIQRAIIRDVLESGDPEGYFQALTYVIDVLEDHVDDNESNWIKDFEDIAGWGDA